MLFLTLLMWQNTFFVHFTMLWSKSSTQLPYMPKQKNKHNSLEEGNAFWSLAHDKGWVMCHDRVVKRSSLLASAMNRRIILKTITGIGWPSNRSPQTMCYFLTKFFRALFWSSVIKSKSSIPCFSPELKGHLPCENATLCPSLITPWSFRDHLTLLT